MTPTQSTVDVPTEQAGTVQVETAHVETVHVETEHDPAIPAEVAAAAQPYDTDTAGGCG